MNRNSIVSLAIFALGCLALALGTSGCSDVAFDGVEQEKAESGNSSKLVATDFEPTDDGEDDEGDSDDGDDGADGDNGEGGDEGDSSPGNSGDHRKDGDHRQDGHKPDKGKPDDNAENDDDHEGEHDGEGKGDGLYICILEGPGKSVRLGFVDDRFTQQHPIPSIICMSKATCLEQVSRAYDVKMAHRRGFCPDKNPHVKYMSYDEMKDMIDNL